MRTLLLAVLGVAACSGGAEEYSSTSQEVVTVAPASYDFGSVTVGQGAGPVTITLRPPTSGNSYDVVNSITESCPDFSVDAPGLPAEVIRTCEVTCVAPQCVPPVAKGAAPSALPCTLTDYQTYQFTASFAPSVPGGQGCTVSINTSSGVKTLALGGTGVPPPIEIDVQPGSVAFGDVRVDTDSTAATVNVRNVGSGTLSVSSVALSGPFTLSGPTSFTVGGGGAQALGVTCHPTGVGGAGGTLVIQNNDTDEGTVSVPLSCNGVDSALDVSPSPAVIATTRVGQPQSISISIGNSGGASTELQGVSITGDGLSITSGPSPGTLGAGASVPVTVEFAATVAGPASGELTVTTSDGSRTAQITALAQVASMSVSPDGLVEFGPVCANQSASRTFSIIGNAEAPFLVTEISTPDAPFSVAAPPLPASVAGSGASTTELTVTASPLASGEVTSHMVISTDIPGDTPRSIDLDVVGLPDGVTPTPTALDLGGKAVATTSVGQRISLTNCTTADVTWSNARIEGANLAEFTVVASPTAPAIASTRSAEWLVVMSPQSVGTKEAEFVVDLDDGTSARVPLTGDGLGEGVGGDDDPTTGGTNPASYYACSAGGSGGTGSFALLSLGVLAVLRRRRHDR